MHTLIITRDQVRGLLDGADVVGAVEHAFARHGAGTTRMPAKVYLPLPEHDGDFRAMPVYFPADERRAARAGVKWVNAHPRNPSKNGLPSVLAVFILNDPETAVPLAILDATEITAARTGAAAAVATRHLAPRGARTLGLIGCGVQAHAVLRAHAAVMHIEEVRLADTRREAAQAVATAHAHLPCVVTDLANAAACDVVCTMTPSRAPIVAMDMLAAAVHINALGADAPGKQELDLEILQRARVFLDDEKQACESGEVNVGLSSGAYRRERLAGTLGAVVAGRVVGRGDAAVTVFDSTGLAVQDLAVADLVYERARAAGIGLELDLVGG
jgi:ornithine cyclodeaminase/alanine dehydrogenase